MPNIENINKLIEVLKSDRAKDRFDMNYWIAKEHGHSAMPAEINECEIVACIGGWCNILQYEETGNKSADSWQEAKDWIGLEEDLAYDLFYSTVSYGITNPLDVIPVLEHLRDTGEVDWSLSPFLNSDDDEE